MGVNTSVQNSNSLITSVNDTLTRVSANIGTSSSSNQISNQRMNLSLRNLKNCGIDIKQTAEMKANSILNSKTQIANDMANELKNIVDKQIENGIKQVNEDLNIGQLNTSIQNTNSKTKTINNLRNIIETGIENSVTTDQNGSQVMYLNADNVDCGRDGQFKITQDMVMDTISKNITDNIVNNTISNSLSNDVLELLKNQADQKNQGLNVFAILTVVIIVVVFGFFLFAMFKTRGISRSLNKKIEETKIPTAYPVATPVAYPVNPPPYSATQMFGGAINKKNKILIVKLSVLCFALIGGFLKFFYIPQKKKINDTYDVSYLKELGYLK